MDSNEEPNVDGHHHNTATENSDGGDTLALQKKRARRVSFAELTSVHFFDVDDEDSETPPLDTEKIGDNLVAAAGLGGQPDQPKDFHGKGNDNSDDEDDDAMEMRRSFLRPIGSPSPGGSTFGSASSNDEDNFFGPVSANFIRPGRLSDAASDDNHDVTMDSTSFSMHFRSLARSDSGVDLKTPTGDQLLFEDKTPTISHVGSSMSFTLGNRPIEKPSLTVTEVSGKDDYDDMSLFGDSRKKYDYEKLSPGLDALLAETRSNLLSVSDIIASSSPRTLEREVLPSTDNENVLLNRVVSAASNILVEANGPQKFSSNTCDEAPNTAIYKPDRLPYQLKKEIPLVNATPPIKQQQILSATASPSRHLVMTTPLLGQPGFFTESKKHRDSEKSIQKSISKLDLLEESAFSSAFSVKVDNSTIKSLDFLRSPKFDALLDSSRHVYKIKIVEGSVDEERHTRAHHREENKDAFAMDGIRTESLNQVIGENHLEESFGHATNGKLPNNAGFGSVSADKLENRRYANSPSKVTGSGNNIMHDLLTSKHFSEVALMTETDSLLAETVGGGKENVTPLKFVSSPVRILEKKTPASPGLSANHYTDLLLQSQFKDFSNSDKGGDSTVQMNLVDVSLSTPVASKDAVSMGMNGELRPSTVEGNQHKNLIEVKETDIREVDNYSEKQTVGAMDNFITPDKGNTLQIMHSKFLDVGNKISRRILRSEDNLSGGESGAVSKSVYMNQDEPILQESLQNMELLTASPSGKEFDDEQLSSIRARESILLSGKLDKLSSNKRNLELLLQDTLHRTETAIMQRSRKQHKGGISYPDPLLYHNRGSAETAVIAHGRNRWIDIYSKFSEDTNQLISRSAGALDSNMIDDLEYVLFCQQKSKVYETLCSGPQDTTVPHDLQLERTAETHSLLYQIVIVKAKLQLKHVKRERLLKRLQLLGSRIQESQMLKTNIPSHLLKTNTSNLLVGHKSLPVNLEIDNQVCDEKLSVMKQMLETIDREILNMKGTLHARCTINAEPSLYTITLLNEHLMKSARRRLFRLDMQMWAVHSIGSENGQHNVVLNYLDFIFQSIKVIVGPTPSASTSYKLNETNIIKNYPNIDVCNAFAFLFNGQTTHMYFGAKSMALETQVTSSLLGTLLDVVEELQLAQMELHNLTQSSFCLPSAEQLNLMLCFYNFKTGKKVIITLDMSCIKRGIYPSDILPQQFTSPTEMQQDSLFHEIRDAVKGIRTGYTRILRLCRCVSQVVQASS